MGNELKKLIGNSNVNEVSKNIKEPIMNGVPERVYKNMKSNKAKKLC